MAKQDPDLSLLFHALSDPTRRAMLERLAQGPAGVTELAISVEDKGGVPEARGPRLPWLFKGALVHKAI